MNWAVGLICLVFIHIGDGATHEEERFVGAGSPFRGGARGRIGSAAAIAREAELAEEGRTPMPVHTGEPAHTENSVLREGVTPMIPAHLGVAVHNESSLLRASGQVCYREGNTNWACSSSHPYCAQATKSTRCCQTGYPTPCGYNAANGCCPQGANCCTQARGSWCCSGSYPYCCTGGCCRN